MGAIAALLGRLQGVFGKTFLMAGVLPALVLVLGLAWYHEGLAGVESLFIHFTAAGKMADTEAQIARENAAAETTRSASRGSETSQAVGVVIFRIIVLLGAGLFFFAIRHLVLTLYQSPPLPQRLRQFLIDRQDVRRRKIESREKLLSLKYTAMHWPIDKFPIPKYRIAGYKTESAASVLHKSKLGWDALQRATDRHGEVPVVRHREYKLICDALISHYSYASAEKFQHPSVIDSWGLVMAGDTPIGLRKKAVYEVCMERASRLWTQAALLKINTPPQIM